MCDNVHNEVYTVNDDFMQVTQMVSLSGSQISDIMLITEFGDLSSFSKGRNLTKNCQFGR